MNTLHPDPAPRISVVIPTYNRCARLQKVLCALEQQTLPADDFEVIVVSDGSTDRTNHFLAKKARETPLHLHYVIQENQGVATARNRGVAEARSALILFLDDDVIPAPKMVAEHLDQQQALGPRLVVLGPMLTPDDHTLSPWVYWEQAMLYRQYADMENGVYAPTARQFYTGNTSLPRSAIVEAGGFDPSFRRAEDIELGFRLHDLGLHFIFHPAARGFHYAERSFSSWASIAEVYGRNSVIFARDLNHSWVTEVNFRELRERHPLIRAAVWAFLGRKTLASHFVGFARRLAEVTYRLNLRRPALLLCSGINNLLFFQGMADEIGGRRRFYAQFSAISERPFASDEYSEA